MDILTIFLRTLLIYFTVSFIMRIMGKREIGKLSVFDLVISIMIAEIAVFVIEDANKPLSEGLVPMFTLVIVQLLVAYLGLKSENLRRFVEGMPNFIIYRGKLNRKEMKRQRYNLDDLLLQLRENNIMNVADVEFALLEPTGKLTVVKKELEPIESNRDEVSIDHSTQESKANVRYEGLPLALIMDGKVQDENLYRLGKTRFWLKSQIQAKGVSDIKDVFFCTIDHRGRLFLDKKK